ncbi:MAG: maleylpyruvate isomerase N-terminal domain-containing protein [Nocardioides sp.]
MTDDMTGNRLEATIHPLDTDIGFTLAQVETATQRYLRTVAGLPDERFSTSSILPGWSVAHVIAHVASNATGITRAIRAAVAGDPHPWVYQTNASRDAEIDERAAWPVQKLRALNVDSTGALRAAFAECPPDKWGVLLPRVIDGPPWSVADWMGARWREVEVHHTDLGVGYTPADWSNEFVDYLHSVAVFDRHPEIAVTLRTPDGDTLVGGGGEVISGSKRDVAWWLIGRGGGAGVTSDAPLPELGPWQRRVRNAGASRDPA